MAIKPSVRYPLQTDTTDLVGYPHGKARNILVVGDGTGTPFEKDLVNDIFGFQQALLVAASITPSGVPEKANASQYLTALLAIITKTLGAATKVTVHTADATGVSIPPEVTEIEVTVVGGGGGGSSGAGGGNNNGGCGGGSGKIYRTRIPRTMVGDTYEVVIGVGGTGGAGGVIGATNANVGSGGTFSSAEFIGPSNSVPHRTLVIAPGGGGGQLTVGGSGYSGGGGSGTDAAGAGAGGARGGNGTDGAGVSGRTGGTGENGLSTVGAGCDGGAAAVGTGIPLQAGGGGAGGPLGLDDLAVTSASSGAPGTGSHTNGGAGGFGYGAGGGGGGQGATASGAGGDGAQGVVVVTFHYGAS
jgi:hypothetical protein